MDFETIDCRLCSSENWKPMFRKQHKDMEFQIVRCNNCGFIFMNPMLTEEGIKKVYNSEYFHDYSSSVIDEKDRKSANIFYHYLLKKIEKQTGMNKGNLLDIGCATGLFLDSVKKANPGWRLYGCDTSRECVELGRKGLKLNLKVGEIENCNYPENFFELVTMFEVIEHIRSPMTSLKEINRVMKKGGYLVIQTGNNDSLISKIYGKKHSYFIIYHVSYFSLKTIKMALEKNGFNVIKIGGIHYSQEVQLSELGFNVKIYLKLLGLKALEKIKIGNFAVMGGMTVFAQKVKDIEG